MMFIIDNITNVVIAYAFITNVNIKDTLYKDKPFIFYNNILIKLMDNICLT